MNYPSFDEVLQVRELLIGTVRSHWVNDNITSWKWWFLLLSATLPWLLWNHFRDRTRSIELLCYGLMWAVISIIWDLIGVNANFWGYPNKVLPMMQPFFPADLTVIPVTFMFVYQLSTNFTAYIISTVIAAGCFSFIIEPIFIKLKLLTLNNWNHAFSFVGFVLISFFIYGIVNLLKEH
ncbi:CBO0543 family protein [Heyndrickxia ginsengihumi]|uniref:CBO0543 family protein n=1 Tax=Heyndrickxia ginsengihumi TaxID=363870 RepID=UPI003D1B0F2D